MAQQVLLELLLVVPEALEALAVREPFLMQLLLVLVL